MVRERPAGARCSPPARPTSSEDPSDVTWTVTRDVLRRTTTCAVRHGSAYAVPHDGTASEQYAGEVVVDRRTFAQHASADCTFRLTWPGVDVRVDSTMRVDVTADGYDVAIEATAYDGDGWSRTAPGPSTSPARRRTAAVPPRYADEPRFPR